ncbi:MAG TPA: A24 family peptidase [Rhizomicrobium sp.]|jgi:leader peptidase (prepilin peptidase)/N-methyltransferase
MSGMIIERLLAVLIALGGGWAAAGIIRRYDESADPRYTVLTLAAIVMALWAYLTVTPNLLALSCCLGWALLVLASIDLRVHRLPDILTLPLIVLGFLMAVRLPDVSLTDRLIGAAAGYGAFAGLAYLYRSLRGRDGLGLGDAKLAAAAGAWLGWQALPTFVLLACAGGFVWITIRLLRSGAGLHTPLPFGVPLAGAFWLMWLYGPLITPPP